MKSSQIVRSCMSRVLLLLLLVQCGEPLPTYKVEEGDTDIDTDADADTETNTEKDTNLIISECNTAKDCILINDCCTCMAAGIEAPSPYCEPTPCVAPACAPYTFGPVEVACNAGRCVINLSCDDRAVDCKMKTPVCPEGEIPVVNESGTCWAGPCLEPSQCSAVADCAVCAPEEVCVEYQTQLSLIYHCVKNTQQCANDVTCKCLGHSVCISPFDECKKDKKKLSCSCPYC